MVPSLLASVILYVIWLLLSGHYDWLLLAFGVISVAGTLYCVSRMRRAQEAQSTAHGHPQGDADPTAPDSTDQHLSNNPIKYHTPFLRGLTYCGWLAKEILMSNIDVARRVWQRDMSIDPVTLVVPDHELDDIGKVIYANSITLTPGTVSLFLREDGIHVHALTQQGANALAEGEMLRRVQNLRVVDASVFRPGKRQS